MGLCSQAGTCFRAGVDHRPPVHGSEEPLAIPDVAYEKSQVGGLESGFAHFVLLQLIPAEDDDLLRLKVALQDLNELPSE
jgi:hypothetical protein